MKILRLFFFLIFFSALNHLLAPKLSSFSELSYFLYDRITKYSTNDWKGNPSILVLGDSQVMSGLTPEMFAADANSVLFLPRPSEQVEGILLSLPEILEKFPSIQKVYLNISPITLAKSDIVSTHKKLVLFSKPNLYEVYKSGFFRFYFPESSTFFYQLAISAFPILQFNSQISSVFKLLPQSESIQVQPNSLVPYLEFDPINELQIRKKQNEFLETRISSHQIAWTWNQFSKISESEVKHSKNSTMDLQSRLLFAELRKDVWERYSRLERLLEDRNIALGTIHLPFSPQFEKNVYRTWERKFLEERKKKGKLVIDLTGLAFEPYDFVDITHLGESGRKKIKNFLLQNSGFF